MTTGATAGPQVYAYTYSSHHATCLDGMHGMDDVPHSSAAMTCRGRSAARARPGSARPGSTGTCVAEDTACFADAACSAVLTSLSHRGPGDCNGDTLCSAFYDCLIRDVRLDIDQFCPIVGPTCWGLAACAAEFDAAIFAGGGPPTVGSSELMALVACMDASPGGGGQGPEQGGRQGGGAGAVIVGGGSDTCETANYVTATSAAECEALALSIGEAFNGNAGSDMPGCMRWQGGVDPAVGWSWNDGGFDTSVCAGDAGSRGYECLCVGAGDQGGGPGGGQACAVGGTPDTLPGRVLVDSGAVVREGYVDHEDCMWILECTTPDTTPHLTFESFDLELGYDYVEVYDEHGQELGRYSGSSIPADVTGAGNMVVQFTSDFSITGVGFRARFQCVAGPGVSDDVPPCVSQCAVGCGLVAPPEFMDTPHERSDTSGCTFAYFDTREDFAGAEASCVAMGGHLASLHDDRDQETLQRIVHRDCVDGSMMMGFSYDDAVQSCDYDKPVWIGFTDATTEGTFTWTDGTPADYENWQAGEPNDWHSGSPGEDCTAAKVRPGNDVNGVPVRSWNDVGCDGRLDGYVCSVCGPTTRADSCTCLAACDYSACDAATTTEINSFITDGCGCSGVAQTDLGHPEFCTCHPALCTSGVGNCWTDQECSGDLQCIDWSACTDLSTYQTAFAAESGCTPDATGNNPWECAPQCCGRRCWIYDTQADCPSDCEWSTTGNRCRSPPQACDTLSQEHLCNQQWEECFWDWTSPVCGSRFVNNGCGACGVDWNTGAAVEASATDQATCTASFPALQWHGCESWMISDDYCDPMCNSAGCADTTTGLIDGGACNYCAAGCQRGMLGDEFCHDECNNAACGTDAGCRLEFYECRDVSTWEVDTTVTTEAACLALPATAGTVATTATAATAATSATNWMWMTESWRSELKSTVTTEAACLALNTGGVTGHTWRDPCAAMAAADCNADAAANCQPWQRGDWYCDTECNVASCNMDSMCLTANYGRDDTGAAASCVETATGLLRAAADTAACGVATPLSDSTACADVMKAADSTVAACTYTAAVVAMADHTTEVACLAANGIWSADCYVPPPPPPVLVPWNPDSWVYMLCQTEEDNCRNAGGGVAGLGCMQHLSVDASGTPYINTGVTSTEGTALLACYNNVLTSGVLTNDACAATVALTEASGSNMLISLSATAYVADATCDWTVQCNAGNIAIVEFMSFETEANYDFLYFIESLPTDTRVEIGRWDGWKAAGSIVMASGDYIRLSFESDYSVQRAGFQATARCATPAVAATLVQAHSCDTTSMVDLASHAAVPNAAGARVASFDTTTRADDLQLSCGSSGNEIIFQFMLPAGSKIELSVPTTAFMGKLETRVGGACPGDIWIDCTDDFAVHEYVNGANVPVPVYFTVDASWGGVGTFQVQWRVEDATAVVGRCQPVLAPFMLAPSAAECNSGLFFEGYSEPANFGFSMFNDGVMNAITTAGNDDWMGWMPFVSHVQSPSDLLWFEGDWEFVDLIDGFDLVDRYVLRWRGQISIPVAGTYIFKTGSDDGSILLIDGVEVVNNDGLHGTRWEEGSVSLTAGLHSIVIIHFENGGGSTLMVAWTPTPGAPFDKLDRSVLSNNVGCAGASALSMMKFKACTTATDCAMGGGGATAGSMFCSSSCLMGECDDGMDLAARAGAGAASDTEAATRCAIECDAVGYCCNDWTVGSNQLISCAQACMIAYHGAPQTECTGLCANRMLNPACSTSHNGITYSHCASCDDLDATCPHGVQDDAACNTGCGLGNTGGSGTGFCQPVELCMPWDSVSGTCPTPATPIRTVVETDCLASAGVDVSWMTFTAWDATTMTGGWDPSMTAAGTSAGTWEAPVDDFTTIDWGSAANNANMMGEVAMASTGDGDFTMYMQGAYTSPVVLVGIPTSTSTGEAIVRIRSVDTAMRSITFYLDTPNHPGSGAQCGVDAHGPESFSWSVVESGIYDTWQAGTVDTSTDTSQYDSWIEVSFAPGLFHTTPLILTTIQTHNGDDWVKTRHDVDQTQPNRFRVRLEEDRHDSTHAQETIGFVALNFGTGHFGGLAFEALAVDHVTHDESFVQFSVPFASGHAGLFGSIATHRGGDPAALRLSSNAGGTVGPCPGGTWGCQAVRFGMIGYETRFSTYAIPSGGNPTFANALAEFSAAPLPSTSNGAYCSTSLVSGDGMANHEACSTAATQASTSDIVFHYTVPITVDVRASYRFRMHADWGGSGFTCFDLSASPQCTFHGGDIWGHIFFDDQLGPQEPMQQTIHELAMIGFEGCCDSHAEIEIAMPSECTCRAEPEWLEITAYTGTANSNYECRCAGDFAADSARFFIEEETCSDAELNHMEEIVHLLAIEMGAAISYGPETCLSQASPTCGEALALMNGAIELDSSSMPLEVTRTWTAAEVFKFAPVGGMMVLETEALDGMQPFMQVFGADGLRKESSDYNWLDLWFPPRVRYPCLEQSFDGYPADYPGMVCDMDGTDLEATCERVLSSSDLTPGYTPTAAAPGELLCIGPPLPDWVYVAVHHQPDWAATGSGTSYKIKLNDMCSLSATRPEDVWACDTQTTCQNTGHRWRTMPGSGSTDGWCEQMPTSCDATTQFTCADFATSGQCIMRALQCDGMDSLGNTYAGASYGADCADGSDEGAASCVGVTDPFTGRPFERYSCQPGAIGCTQCGTDLECIEAGCSFTNGACARPRTGGTTRAVDTDCMIPARLLDVCIDEYCTRECNTAITAWWQDAKHAAGGTCTQAFTTLGIPQTSITFIRNARQQCSTRVGCPVGTKELKLGLFDSYGDGWGYGPSGTASPGHQITVKHLDVVLASFPRTLTGGSDIRESVEYTCVPEVSTNDFGCISVSVDSSTDCSTRVGGVNCWSSEVGWSLHTIDRQSGVETLMVQEYTAPGIAGGEWTNGHANCPSVVAPVVAGGSGVASTQGHCSIGEVMCGNGVECIPEAYLCDGDLVFGNAHWGPDCVDSSDEVWEWCADPARDDDDRLSHNRFRPVGPTGGVNLARVCSLGEPSFMCTMSGGRVEGCAVDGCSACYFCDDTTPDCLLEPAACLASGCFWDTAATECRMPVTADQALPAGCQDLQLDPSCSDDSEYCPVACYDSLQLITPACLAAFETVGVSAAWSAQVQALKAGRCNVGGCSGTGRTELRFQMRDAWGDGWNEPGTTGNEFEITSTSVADVVTSETGTLLEGAEAEKNLCVNSAATKCVMVHVKGDGTYPEEIAWTVKDAASGATLTPRATMNAHLYYLFNAVANGCAAVTTPAKMFRCRGGVMINWNLLCDGNFDCRDQDDEVGGGLAGFCPHVASCDVLTPSRVGNGFCDAGTDYDTMGCGYDGGGE